MVLLMAENFAYQVFYESSLEKRAEILARARYYLGRAQQACQRLENMSSKLPVFVAIINLRLKWVTKHLELLEQWHLQNMKAYVLESKTDITWAECEQAREDPAIPRFILAYMSESVRYREKTGKAISPGQLMERDKIRIDQCRYPTNDCLRPHEQNNFLETGQLNAEQQHHLENCHACYALLAASYQLRHKSEELPAVLANISISNPNKSA